MAQRSERRVEQHSVTVFVSALSCRSGCASPRRRRPAATVRSTHSGLAQRDSSRAGYLRDRGRDRLLRGRAGTAVNGRSRRGHHLLVLGEKLANLCQKLPTRNGRLQYHARGTLARPVGLEDVTHVASCMS